jgi:transcription antitermination factor NusG
MKEWYILHHPERFFPCLQRGLESLNVEYFMPIIQEYSPRKDRLSYRARRPKPLFPCYMFIHLDPEEVHTSEIMKLNGAASFLRFGERLYTISEKEINAMKYIEFRLLHKDNDQFSCIGATPALLKRMQQVYNTKHPEHRVAALNALLVLPMKNIA